MLRTVRRTCTPFIVLALAACASAPSAPPTPLAPVIESSRPTLGKVGVVSMYAAPSPQVLGPLGVGREAARGAVTGAAIGVASAGYAASTVGASVGASAGAILAVPGVGPVVGIIVGVPLLVGAAVAAANAIPESTYVEIDSALWQAIAFEDPQRELRAQIVSRAKADVRQPPVDLGVREAFDPMSAPDYAPLADEGVQTVLEVAVLTARFTGEGGRDPELTLSMRARARLIGVANNRVLWSDDYLEFTTPRHRFSDWTANDAALLKSVIDNAVSSFAGRISDRAFLEFWSNTDGGTWTGR